MYKKKQRKTTCVAVALPVALPPQSTGITIFLLLWQLWQQKK
jgi:hypothetical protein